ncbi:Acetyltransferase (GNAT) family protein [Formivibrio citricus]|uniref:Acetyltransferase (GNAT) family protein n=1 Tax=Formivibrio citricus TaxID=83765 RepID=A0A1I5C1M5_9NEIS|nr:GNAT family N-acetyltransferase [Formivibrio citricus]SFN80953.1 Acetyltransferase (GNAT) family protein [Formivibrio citricus]
MMAIFSPEQADLELFCSLKGLSELTPASVRLHAPDRLLMCQEQGGLRARASVWWCQVPEHGSERLGLVGHYAAQDSIAGSALLEEACRVLAECGCSLAVGPMDGSTWRRYRLLTERGDEPPFLLEPDNPDDWPQYFESAGFQPLAHYYSSISEDNARCQDCSALQMRLEQEGYVFRAFANGEIDAELDRLWQLSCESFKDNFLYSPIGKAEFLGMYAPLLSRIRPELIQIAEWQGTPVGFCMALPNLLQAQRGQPVDTVIIKSLATLEAHRGKGLAAVMLARINRIAQSQGMRRTIHALMHEDNPSRQINRGLMRDFRRYALYARHL